MLGLNTNSKSTLTKTLLIAITPTLTLKIVH